MKNSTARAAALGMVVTELMEAKSLKGVDLKELLGWNDTKVSRLKSGVRPPRVIDLAMILAVLEVKGDERRELLTIAESLGQQNTWLPPTISLSGRTRFIARLERIATRLTSFSQNRFPPLLQSREQVKSLANNTDGFKRDMRARFFVGEVAFTPKALQAGMTADLLHELLRLAVRPNIQIRLVPDSVVIVPDSPSFTHMSFPDHSPLVHIEAMNTSAFLEHDTAVDNACIIIEALHQQALPVEATRTRLAALAASVADTSTAQLAESLPGTSTREVNPGPAAL
jgi:uncharacterized protein DUF5753